MTTFWHRIEPNTTSPELEEGLKALIADPMWMLARQWQLGEFHGEDAASPIHARLLYGVHALETFASGADDSDVVEVLPRDQPLECRAEAESVWDGPAAIRLSADAGLQLLRRFDAAGERGVWGAIREAYPLAIDGVALARLPVRERRRLELLSRRALDGARLFEEGPGALDPFASDSAHGTVLSDLLAKWRSEVEATYCEPGGGGGTWAEERLEYTFSVGASTTNGEVVLSASEYPGGHLDWYSFDLDSGSSHGLAESDEAMIETSLLPTPVTYRGMPASRWWEFEDSAVYFGDLSAGPEDLARLIVAEFMACFSDDWFVLPLKVPVGTLSRVTALEVLDTFGEVHSVPSTAVRDEETYGSERPWAFFELSNDGSAASGENPWLLVPSSVLTSLNGRPLESVSMIRDEAANLVWGVEERTETPTGRSTRRRQQWASNASNGSSSEDADAAEDATASDDEESTSHSWTYRLATEVPPYWVPFVPERTADGVSMRLRRGRLLAWDLLDRDLVGAQGRLLAAERPLTLYEEEVPAGGLQLTRSWQLARGADGAVRLWMARRKRPGRGERGSGLKMDVIETG